MSSLTALEPSSDSIGVIPIGLASREASERLEKFGPNDPTPPRKHSAVAELLLLCINPLVIILLLAAVLSGFIGELVDAAIIVSMVLVGIAANFYQTYRSKIAIESLRARVTPTATALRNGQWKEINRVNVVPGDIVRLSAGDLVPADARLLTARDLFVHEAALTGESMPYEKSAAADAASRTGKDRNMVFLGTSVVSGAATGEVTATGRQTRFGDIAERLAARSEETAFDRGLRQFGVLIMRTVIFLVLFLMVVSIALHHDGLESLLFAVALAVGLTPEFLPMITSVTLAKGAVVMAKKKVIVKHLSAIQNFGSIDVLCSDKTGTLTEGNMLLQGSFDPSGHPSERPLELAYINSKFETGIRSPLDAAILKAPVRTQAGFVKHDEIPFDFERRRLSIVVGGESTWTLITKGSPEGIFSLLSASESNGQISPINLANLSSFQSISDGLGRQGFRVLAVAYRIVAPCKSFSAADERELTLAGFLAFGDPTVPDAGEAIAALKRDGVEVKILTGDNDLVTRRICGEVGIDPGNIVLGSDSRK